jgi:hypothetical protein
MIRPSLAPALGLFLLLSPPGPAAAAIDAAKDSRENPGTPPESSAFASIPASP